MGAFSMDSGAVGGAADQISAASDRIKGLPFTGSFATLSGAFTGATNPMREVAGNGDSQVKTSLTHASGTVKAWSELVSGFKNSAEESDADNAVSIRNAVQLPTAPVVDPRNQN